MLDEFIPEQGKAKEMEKSKPPTMAEIEAMVNADKDVIEAKKRRVIADENLARLKSETGINDLNALTELLLQNKKENALWESKNAELDASVAELGNERSKFQNVIMNLESRERHIVQVENTLRQRASDVEKQMKAELTDKEMAIAERERQTNVREKKFEPIMRVIPTLIRRLGNCAVCCRDSEYLPDALYDLETVLKAYLNGNLIKPRELETPLTTGKDIKPRYELEETKDDSGVNWVKAIKKFWYNFV